MNKGASLCRTNVMPQSSRSRTDGRRHLGDDPTIGEYKLLKTIGKGNFAKVKLAKHIPTGREVAIKIIDRTQLTQASLQKVRLRIFSFVFLNVKYTSFSAVESRSAYHEDARSSEYCAIVSSARDREHTLLGDGVREWRWKI